MKKIKGFIASMVKMAAMFVFTVALLIGCGAAGTDGIAGITLEDLQVIVDQIKDTVDDLATRTNGQDNSINNNANNINNNGAEMANHNAAIANNTADIIYNFDLISSNMSDINYNYDQISNASTGIANGVTDNAADIVEIINNQQMVIQKHQVVSNDGVFIGDYMDMSSANNGVIRVFNSKLNKFIPIKSNTIGPDHPLTPAGGVVGRTLWFTGMCSGIPYIEHTGDLEYDVFENDGLYYEKVPAWTSTMTYVMSSYLEADGTCISVGAASPAVTVVQVREIVDMPFIGVVNLPLISNTSGL